MTKAARAHKILFHICRLGLCEDCKEEYIRYGGPNKGHKYMCTCTCHGKRKPRSKSKSKKRRTAA
jgi:hypothetical protein